MSKAINRENVRKNLPPQNEPHWGPEIGEGLYLGFRKTKDGSGSWVARFQRGKVKKYRTLGKVADMSYVDAKQAAEGWGKNPMNAPKRGFTVADACKVYTENQQAEKTETAAKDSDRRFRQLVYGKPFGDIRLDQLTADDVETWRNAQDAKNNTINRNMRSLRAALNYARKKRWVIDDHPWMAVDFLRDDTKAREVYLDQQTRARLLDAADEPLRQILRGFEFTGCRPGELRHALVSDFDPKTCTLTARDDKGSKTDTRVRSVPLTEKACAFFREVRGNRAGAVPLFVDDRGMAWTENRLNGAFRVARDRAGLLDNIVIYCYRHTRIADLLLAGIDPATVGKITGTSIEMISKHYHKFVRTAVIDKLEEIESEQA